MITVVIPNYNGRLLLEKFLPSVFSSLAYAKADFEFIVVDDCSTDTSIPFLRAEYPQIKILKNNSNIGFARTCNRGIMAAKGEHLLLLNTDIELTPSYIKKCLDGFVNNNTFAVMGLAMDDSPNPQTTGIFFKQKTFSIKKYPNHSSNETHFISGANTLFDTKKIQEIGGFNPIFSPYYFEDDDLSFRAMLKGWKSYFLKDALCYHLGSSTIKSSARKRKIKRVYFRNKIIFNRLHSKSSIETFNLKNLVINVLPKYCIGKFWIWNSYNDYLALTQEN